MACRHRAAPWSSGSPGSGDTVKGHSVRCVEPERVEMGAADPVILNHLVRAAPPSRSGTRGALELLLPVDHGPLMQAEAAELSRPCGGASEDLNGKRTALRRSTGKPPCRTPLRCCRAAGPPGRVHRRRAPCSTSNPGGRQPPFREHHTVSGMPPQQLAGFLCVIREEEILHGMLPPGGAAAKVGVGVAARPVHMRSFPFPPVGRGEDPGNGVIVNAVPATVRQKRPACSAEDVLGGVPGSDLAAVPQGKGSLHRGCH